MSSGSSRILFLAVSSLLLMLCIGQPPSLEKGTEPPETDPWKAVPEEAPEILLTAHRGDSSHYPENTMAAFQAAVDEGADCIELDIQETADHIFVVCHDQNLLRIAGLDRDISDMRYEELQQIDVGSWFSAEFSGQWIPTLEEVLQFAKKSQLYLNIEIKALSPGSEWALLSMLRRCGMEGQCILACQNYSVLTRLKACVPKIRTLYVTASPPSDPASLTDADEISVAYSVCTEELLQQVHSCGKNLHIWTVNTPDTLQNMAALHPDALITDDPALALEILRAS